MKNHLLKKLSGSLFLGVVLSLVAAGCSKSSTPSAANQPVSTADMNQALAQMAINPDGGPKTFEELTNSGWFSGRTFPTPPPGKKFAINPAAHQVIVVDQ